MHHVKGDAPATPMKNGCDRWRRLARAVPGESAGRLLCHDVGDVAPLPAFSGDRLPPLDEPCDIRRLKSSFWASTLCVAVPLTKCS